MKSILIFFILYNVASAKPHNKECSLQSLVQYVDNNFPNNTALVDYLFTKNPSDDTLWCKFACVLQKWADKKGKTLEAAALNTVNDVYAKGFETKKFTRQEVESKITNCANNTERGNSCAFFKCIDVLHTPFLDLMMYQGSIPPFMLQAAKNVMGDHLQE